MNSYKDIKEIIIIDDEEHWIDKIKDKILREYPLYIIRCFNDFKNFKQFDSIENAEIIITDFYFSGYNLDQIDNKFNDFKGKVILVTGYPNAVSNIDDYSRIINKANINKPTFKFSRYF